MLRLRQTCCHLSLLKSIVDDEELSNLQGEYDNKEDLSVKSENKKKYELEEVESMATSMAESAEKTKNIAKLESLATIENDKDLAACFQDSFLSSKFVILLEMLDQVLESNPNDKIIIISQWTSVLQKLINNLFEKKIRFYYINGQVELEERHQIVENFNDLKNLSRRVMLLSLGCGGGNF
jgi:transcription termination factor 2